MECDAGTIRIASRATDKNGVVQPEQPAWNPSGYLYNAIDPIEVEVRPRCGLQSVFSLLLVLAAKTAGTSPHCAPFCEWRADAAKPSATGSAAQLQGRFLGSAVHDMSRSRCEICH